MQCSRACSSRSIWCCGITRSPTSERASRRCSGAGVGFGIGTSAAYACFLLILRSAGGEQKPHVAGQLADATAGAAAGALLLAPVAGGLQLSIPWPSFFWLLTLALLGATVGWLLITSSLPRLPAAISSLILLLQPAGALALADAVLGERPTLIQVG